MEGEQAWSNEPVTVGLDTALRRTTVYGGACVCTRRRRKQWTDARARCGSACAKNPSLDTPVDGGAVCVAPCSPAVCVKGNGGERGEESAVARGLQPP